MKQTQSTVLLAATALMLGGFSITAQAGTLGIGVNSNTNNTISTGAGVNTNGAAGVGVGINANGNVKSNNDIYTQSDTRINGGANAESRKIKAQNRARSNARLGNDSDFGIYSFNE